MGGFHGAPGLDRAANRPLPDGDRYVVFASHAGEAEVLLAGERFRVRAREAEGGERERLWSEVTRRDDAYVERGVDNSAHRGRRAGARLRLRRASCHAIIALPGDGGNLSLGQAGSAV